VSVAEPPAKPKRKGGGTRGQLRGSSLLLFGRFLSKGLNFASQVLIVRYLSRGDYGAFAYALSIVAMGETFVTFGLDRAVTRFVPIYHEKEDYRRTTGTLALVFSVIVALSLLLVLLFFSLQEFIAGTLIDDQQAVTLLLILIFLAPVQALDTLLNGLFAVFSRPRAIFFRKYVVGPLLKIGVVILLIVASADVRFLAAGYLAAAVLALVIFGAVLVQVLREQDLLRHFGLHGMKFPAREILAFTVPLLSSDLVFVVMSSVDAILLGYYQGSVDVAAMRAVQPAAKINQDVLASFGLLFTPTAARMFARNDRKGVNELYWQNAIWIAILSFPIFAVTFSLARPITLLLYGDRYAESAIILALLSAGYYFNAALGQNGLTLKVFGRVRYVVIINLFTAVLSVILNLLLIPSYGALGAAVGTTITLFVFNLLKQAGLALGTGINLFEGRYRRGYIVLGVAAGGLLLFQILTDVPIGVGIVLAGLTSLLVLRLNRDLLNVEATFPEILRLPFARQLLGIKKPTEPPC
jgi:O-antigen/teichoic acid export membrane protein